MFRYRFFDNIKTFSQTQSRKSIEDLQELFTTVVMEALQIKDLLPYEKLLLHETLKDEIPYQVSAYEERYKRLAKNILIANGIIYNHQAVPERKNIEPIMPSGILNGAF